MRIYLLAALLLVCPFSYASTVVWHQQYYPGVSKVTHLPTTYCEQTTPGIFIGTVELQIKNGALTDKQIYLSHFTFHESHMKTYYHITGTVIESGKINNTVWQDKIYYYLNKETKEGVTTGIWMNSECKGYYKGYVTKYIK